MDAIAGERLAYCRLVEGAVKQPIGRRGRQPGPNDGNQMLAESVEVEGQCTCFGSDQAERPVRTSNFLRSWLTT